MVVCFNILRRDNLIIGASAILMINWSVVCYKYLEKVPQSSKFSGRMPPLKGPDSHIKTKKQATELLTLTNAAGILFSAAYFSKSSL